MAEAPRANIISPLNILFEDLQEEMDASDVMKMKRLLRGKQLSKQEIEKLESASDVFHHLNDQGNIGVNDLDLLVEIFTTLCKDPLRKKVVEFQREHALTTDNAPTSVSSRGKKLNQTSSEETTGVESPESEQLNGGGQYSSKLHMQTKSGIQSLTAQVAVEIDEDEEERESRKLDLRERRIKIEEREVKVELKKQLVELVKKYINSLNGNDTTKIQECKTALREYRAVLRETKEGSLFFILSFLTEEDLDYFWQKYKEGTVDKTLTRILIPPYIRAKAEKAGITFRIRLEIDEKEYERVKQHMHETEMSAVTSSCRATSHRVKVCVTDQWETFVMDQVQDKQQAKKLLELSQFDPVVDALRQEEFFFPSLIWQRYNSATSSYISDHFK
ncbi:uncharacterized protein PF3D7_1120000-like [Ptychodera flava]|uniref:uncharacterized protein PF3D7_1120000-like n=1 Tax=Ptychodera flava TaxID=63121 RepID=UPI00396A23C7